MIEFIDGAAVRGVPRHDSLRIFDSSRSLENADRSGGRVRAHARGPGAIDRRATRMARLRRKLFVHTLLLGVALTLVVILLDGAGFLAPLDDWFYDQRALRCQQ